jgi:hypothetical protein
MTLNDIEEKLKNIMPSIEAPKGLAERVIATVSEHALKKKRRKLIWQYLGHGFTSVIVFYFVINWIAPDVASRNMVISGAVILAMFWLMFKVTDVANRQHFGRVALSAASFGFVVAITGLVTLTPGTGINSPADDELMVLPSMPEIIEQAAEEMDAAPNILAPMEEEKTVDEYAGNGFFGNVISIHEGDNFVFIKTLLDTGEELTQPVPIEIYTKNTKVSGIEVGDRVYIENQFIHPVDENVSPSPKSSQGVFMES